MSKEELIKLIESLTIEEIRGLTLSYYSEEKEETYNYGCKTEKERELKTISYGEDINKKLEYIRRDMEENANRTQQYCFRTIEEMIDK